MSVWVSDSRRCFSPVSIVQCWDLPLPCCCYKCDWRAVPYFVCQWQPLWAMRGQWDMWTRGQLPRPSETTGSTCSTLTCPFPGDLSGLLSEKTPNFILKRSIFPQRHSKRLECKGWVKREHMVSYMLACSYKITLSTLIYELRSKGYQKDYCNFSSLPAF